jgi:hypothetical protein
MQNDSLTGKGQPRDSPILRRGFVAAIALSAGSLISITIYLFWYLHTAFQSFEQDVTVQFLTSDIGRLEATLLARTALWKFALQSCGIISGVGLGFLGFGLFLIGIQGEMEAGGSYGQYRMLLRRMTPGTFVITVSAVVIGVCATHKIELDYGPTRSVQPAAEISERTNASPRLPDPPAFIDATNP